MKWTLGGGGDDGGSGSGSGSGGDGTKSNLPRDNKIYS